MRAEGLLPGIEAFVVDATYLKNYARTGFETLQP